MRADRLLSILMLLQTKGRMTAREMAERLEVSERTIYRDIEALGRAGIPIYTSSGPNGGCSLIDGYQTRLTGLTATEARALFLFDAASSLANLGLREAYEAALLKLAAALPEPLRPDVDLVRQRVYFDQTRWYHSDETQSSLKTLEDAIWQERLLCLTYEIEQGVLEEVVVEPYGLVCKAHLWYLVCLIHEQFSVLRIPNIHAAILLDEHFTRRETFNLSVFWSEWCEQAERKSPRYAIPLHLAPDESTNMLHVLRSWGYVLIEHDELQKVHYPAIPATPQEKKEHMEKFSPSRNQKSKRLSSLRQAGRPGQHQKKRIRHPLIKKTSYRREFNKKNAIPLTSIKKTTPAAKKKNALSSPLKKENIPLNSTKKAGVPPSLLPTSSPYTPAVLCLSV